MGGRAAMKTLLSFGHGYSARALTTLLDEGWRVIGTTRCEESAAKLDHTGIETRIWPGDDLSPDIEAATHVLTSVSPGENGDPVLNMYRNQLEQGLFDWVGYLSTTGVYGDHQGGWVDETTPLTPSTKRGQWRKAAEEDWQSLSLPLHVFRLAGIYGPGRGPFAKVRAGTARRIIKRDQIFSRIHVEDIAQVLLASIDQPNSGAVYNLCDDAPAPPEDVLAYAAQLLDVPVPPAVGYDTADMTPMARSFYAESKRVRNDRIKSELGVQLKYPDFQTGLKAILKQDG